MSYEDTLQSKYNVCFTELKYRYEARELRNLLDIVDPHLTYIDDTNREFLKTSSQFLIRFDKSMRLLKLVNRKNYLIFI